MSKPSAIITKLEDCPVWLDRMLLKAYLEADYLLESLDPPPAKRLLFRFDQPANALEQHLKQFDIQSFAIITAFNPGSNVLPLEENLRRNELLVQKLLPHCSLLRKSMNQNAAGEWQEPGFWALNLDLKLAVEFGRDFDQLAIVCWKRGEAVQLWCM